MFVHQNQFHLHFVYLWSLWSNIFIMECTQRLESTQDLYGTERKLDQIGFLGICGTKYPIFKGPNKIGRDPQTCSVVLNLNSISRQHAVINVLSGNNFMLMDLDSANKTKLMGKSLPPYIPHPIKNGDMVQFGDVFGVFRLLEEEDELPMTQALDIPDTPVCNKYASRINHATTIPESPDLSDKDESFIVPSQPKHQLKSTNKSIKTSNKTIPEPVRPNKIDNMYWNSSKKSSSLYLDDSSSFDDSSVSNKSNKCNNEQSDIHDMETQAFPNVSKESTDSIFTAATQLPPGYNCVSIHDANTQLPEPDHLPQVQKIHNQQDLQIDLYTANKENDTGIYNADTQLVDKNSKKANKNNSIFEADTQLPNNEFNVDADKSKDTCIFEANTQLPSNEFNVSMGKDRNNCIFEADTQLPSNEFNVYTGKNKDTSIFEVNTQLPDCSPKNNSIYEAATQLPTIDDIKPIVEKKDVAEEKSLYQADTQLPDDYSKNKSSIFDAATQLVGIENAQVESGKKSDASEEEILFEDMDSQSFADDLYSQPLMPQTSPMKDIEINLSQRNTYNDESKEFPAETNKVSEIKESTSAKRSARLKSDSSTDCEDIEISPAQKMPVITLSTRDDSLTDCEDELFADDKPKQFHVTETTDETTSAANTTSIQFEDMLTQVIEEDVIQPNTGVTPSTSKNTPLEDMPTQVLNDDDTNKEVAFEDLATQVLDCDVPINTAHKDASQETIEETGKVFKIPFPTPIKSKKNVSKTPEPRKSDTKAVPDEEIHEQFYAATQDIYNDLCTQVENSPEIVTISTKLGITGSPSKRSTPTKYVRDKSSASSDDDVSVVDNLSSSQIREVIGVDPKVSGLKRMGSDLSDGEITPIKVRSFFLPDSQEIRSSVTSNPISLVTDSSSDTEPDEDSQDGTPILFHRKTRAKANAKADLTKKFDSSLLPTRVITRLRKPTAKLLDCDEESVKLSHRILKPMFLTEQDLEVDQEIINENLSRLKKGKEKQKSVSPKSESASKDVKDTSKSASKTKNNKNEDRKDKKTKQTEQHTETGRPKSRNSKSTHKNETVTEQENDNKHTEQGRPQSRNSRSTHKNETVTEQQEKDSKHTEQVRPQSRNSRSSHKKSETVTERHDKDTTHTEQVRPHSRVSRRTHKTVTGQQDKDIEQVERDRPKRHNKNESVTKQQNKDDTKDRIKEKKNESVVCPNKSKSIVVEPEVNTKPYSDSKKNTSKPKKKDTKALQQETPSNSVLNYFTRNKNESPKEEPQSVSISKTTIEAMLSTSNTYARSLRSNDTTKNTSRGTRSKTKVRVEIKTDSPKKEQRKRGRPRKDEKRSNSPEKEIEVRRSRRQKTVLESSKHEQVYNVSTEVASPKRKREGSVEGGGKRARAQTRVCVTGLPGDELRAQLETLGAECVESALTCDVVVAGALRRTLKLLCAVGRGRPVVGPAWVQAAVRAQTLPDPWQYLIQDTETERRFQFDLRSTLQGPRGFLRGYHLSATPSVLPREPEMKMIVECSGGTWSPRPPRGGCWVCVSCGADRARWGGLRARGAALVTPEFVLTGVLRQSADVRAHELPAH